MDDTEASDRDLRTVAPVVQTQPVVKKLIQRTGQSKPTFPPVVITFDRSGAETKRPRVVKN